jgi:hypothetical protein
LRSMFGLMDLVPLDQNVELYQKRLNAWMISLTGTMMGQAAIRPQLKTLKL